MNKLTEIIKSQIRDKGPMTFAKFMEFALYHPSYGYYSSGKANIGKEGDFYTSSHVHKTFGRVIANFILRSFDIIDEEKPAIIEIGAGKGYLALDILDQIKKESPDYYEHLTYYIVERNINSIDEPKTILRNHSQKLKWIEELRELYNKNIAGVVLSNELYDALPFNRMKFINGQVSEIYLTLDNEKIIEAFDKPSSNNLEEYLKVAHVEFEEGQEFEINLTSEKMLREIDKVLDNGIILTIDYGYLATELFSPDRMNGTYKCLHKHTISENPYNNIGDQDITAHVDFSNLIQLGESMGINKVQYTTQGQFLIDWGILDFVQNSTEKEIQAIKNLFLPELMGDKFKVLIQKKMESDLDNFYPVSPLKISFNVL